MSAGLQILPYLGSELQIPNSGIQLRGICNSVGQIKGIYNPREVHVSRITNPLLFNGNVKLIATPAAGRDGHVA